MGKLDLYIKERPDMKTGDLLQWRSESFLGAAIRFFSRANVNHSGLIISLNEYSGLVDRRFTLEALGSGIVLRLLSERVREHKGRLWLYPLKNEFDICRDAVAEWALLKVGTPYDYKSLLKQVAGRVSSNASRLFCSEYCFMAWKAAGIPVTSKKAPRPGDMPGLGIFKDPVRIL